MAKKKTEKIVSMLSPENFIRHRARTLPIFECLISPRWKEEGLAHIVVARSHTTGNVTVGLYLVDLFCLGVKDSFYQFNLSLNDYRGFIADIEEEGPRLKKCDYALVHNIIYSALEYANELDFKPAKAFSSITHFMLEEDTDEIEFMEIECGKNGKPFFISGPDEDKVMIQNTIRHLERKVGKGNFIYFDQGLDSSNDEWDEDDDEDDDEFIDYTVEEKKQLFLELDQQYETLDEEDQIRLNSLCNSLIMDLCDGEQYERYFNELLTNFEIEVSDSKISAEVLGITSASAPVSEEIKDLFHDLHLQSITDPTSAKKLLKKFRKLLPDAAASYYLELKTLRHEESPKYKGKLDEYSAMFPDYPFIKLMVIEEELENEKRVARYDPSLSIASIFPGRTEIHVFEMAQYLLFLLGLFTCEGDLTRVAAFEEAFDSVPLTDEQNIILMTLLIVSKLDVVRRYLEQ